MRTAMPRLSRTLTAAGLLAAASLGALPACQAAGLLKAKGQPADGVAIKSHTVRVVINNGFARTEVDQVFSNRRDTAMEAVYAFPLPKQASLSELSLWINGREVLGEVVEKQRARDLYEQEKKQGHDTALAEKNDFKTFDISVGRIPPQAETRVRLVYYQPVEIDLGVGRYVYPLAEGNVDDNRVPFWDVDNAVTAGFSFHADLKSAFPIKECRVPGFEQEATIKDQDAATPDAPARRQHYTVDLAQAEGARLAKDLIVYYRLDDKLPGRLELIPYRAAGSQPGTFMVVVTPAADLKPLQGGTDWLFILDRSGSMDGGKIAKLADGVSQAIGKLSPADRFRIVTFNDTARELTGGYVPATPENVQAWLARIKGLTADGGTNLFAGLELGYQALEADRTSAVVLVTDGVCNVGPTEHAAFLKLLKNYDVRLFTFVIGNSANQPLMDRLARESNGFAMNLSEQDDIYGRLIQARAKVANACLHDVRLTFAGEKVSELTPAKPGSLYCGQQLILFGRYTGSGPVNVELSAKISGQPHTWHCTANLPQVDTANPELERLWALSRIDEIMQEVRESGDGSGRRDAIVKLGTTYSLVTDYTSMIVLRDEAAEQAGLARTNAQRIQTERAAQAATAQTPPVNYRVDTPPAGGNAATGGMFNGRSAPSIGGGSGPVGPLFLLAAALMKGLNRRKKTA